SRSRSSRSSNSSNPPTYGYHNTFHTHAQLPPPVPPPTYAAANSERTLRQLNERARAESELCPLPAYTCSVGVSGELGLKQELSSPFQVASNREWQETFVVLQGTQLSIYRPKSPGPFSKTKAVGAGRLIKSFSLQHGEIGVAGDFKKTRPVPKSPFAHLIPGSARQKLFATDPHLFEPVREHVLRLRLETEQFLLCAPSQEEMLDWVEKLCAAVDISPPLEDRSEPRYRSLPRRQRRQRMLDGGRLENLDNLLSLESGRMIIAEQERIIRRLYPHLAGTASSGEPANEGSGSNCQAVAAHASADPETDDLDPEDARFPTPRRTTSHTGESEERPSSSATADLSTDPKSSPPHSHTPAQALRYRRRCAPVLLANSPRVSDVVFSGGKRMRINPRERTLINLVPLPPRYDVHNFPKQKPLATIAEGAAPKFPSAPILVEPPSVPARRVTDDSMTFGYDLSATSSSEQNASGSDADDIRSALMSSEPPSPTLA
ncbi:uncharacterized protein EI97DRAFT_353610, partial [Westerdykella ornata]